MRRIIFILIITFLFTPSVHAAVFFFDPIHTRVGLEGEFGVNLLINTEGENINAIEGEISFPSNLKVLDILDGNSIVGFWIEEPTANKNIISFSGIMPGGFDGLREPFETETRPGKIFEIIFKAEKTGSGAVSISEIEALLNDGAGSRAQVTILPFSFEVLNFRSSVKRETTDDEPPEPFKSELTRDENLFDGGYFLTFHTTDKGSGIDHYEVCESSDKKEKLESCKSFWISEKSPYLLKDQSLKGTIKVKALDKAGNSRIEIVSIEGFSLERNKYGIIILIIIALALFFLNPFRKKLNLK
jgi:hypothetical protein